MPDYITLDTLTISMRYPAYAQGPGVAPVHAARSHLPAFDAEDFTMSEAILPSASCLSGTM